ncbi:MAG: hypothetical protein AAGE65_06250 [Planctomycetota bacterium]
MDYLHKDNLISVAGAWDQHDFLVDMLERQQMLPNVHDFVKTTLQNDLQYVTAQILELKNRRSSYTALLDQAARVKQAERRHFYWMSQAIFHGQACQVGQKILMQNGRSPLVEQFRFEGDLPADFDRKKVMRRLRKSSKTLDVMIHERSKAYEIILVQGQTFEEAKRFNENLRAVAGQANLFGERSLYLINFMARGRDVRALITARDLLKEAFPGKHIKSLFMVCGSPESLPHYQAIDLTDEPYDRCREAWISLDGREPCHTSLDDRESLDGLADRLANHMHYQPPLERAVRLGKLLDVFYDMQVSSQSLVTLTGSQLGTAASKAMCMHYEENLLRHDIEDGLERTGFVRRLWAGKTTFALSPKGVGRAAITRMLGTGDSRSGAQIVLDQEQRQMNRLRSEFLRG